MYQLLCDSEVPSLEDTYKQQTRKSEKKDREILQIFD